MFGRFPVLPSHCCCDHRWWQKCLTPRSRDLSFHNRTPCPAAPLPFLSPPSPNTLYLLLTFCLKSFPDLHSLNHSRRSSTRGGKAFPFQGMGETGGEHLVLLPLAVLQTNIPSISTNQTRCHTSLNCKLFRDGSLRGKRCSLKRRFF